MRFLKTAAFATAATLGSAIAAQAGLIDFTDPSTYTISGNTGSGSVGDFNYTIESIGGNLTRRADGPGATGPLVGDTDGLGIRDDEISFPAESLTITFDRMVQINRILTLDLFLDRQPDEVDEGFTVNGGSPFLAQANASEGDTVGFGDFGGLSLIGTSFTFEAIATNDNRGAPDFALAGLNVAPVPLPAGVLLLGGALAGLGFARRGKKSA